MGRVFLVLVGPMLILGVGELVTSSAGQRLLASDPLYLAGQEMEKCRSAPSLVEWCRTKKLGPGQTAVYTVGGSSVQGYPIRIQSFPKHLATVLRQRSGSRYAVQNFGAMCRDSIFVRQCLAHLQPAPGSIVVLYAGHNDMANFVVPWPSLRYLSEEYPALLEIPRWLAGTHLYSALIDKGGRWPQQPTLTRHRMKSPDYERARDFAIEKYTENLKQILDSTQAQGSRVILATLVSNLYEFPFRKSKWDPAVMNTTEMAPEKQNWQRAYRAGIRAFREQLFTDALSEFKIARDELMVGRAPSMLNDRIRSLAASYPHVTLLDTERILDELGRHEGIGCNFFGEQDWCDQFHPNRRLHAIIGDHLAAIIERLDNG